MRCDNCPLCPTAEDDACPIMDTDYGMEHADGMGGCRHSWNWCKKKADEYSEYLGKMGEHMAQMMKWEDIGFMDAIDKVKVALAELLLCAEDANYSFCVSNWELCFTIFARHLHLTDTEIYEIAEQLKEKKNGKNTL